MSNVKNSNMRHLLSNTEDDIVENPKVLRWDDFRGTWSSTSVTDDMRRMNTQRLLNEIRSRIEYSMYSMSEEETFHQILNRTDSLLHHYRDMGAINDYHVESATFDADGRATMELTINPVATLERIQMEVRLEP